MRQSKFPPGWDQERVNRLIEYYENQTDEEAIAEHEAAFEGDGKVVIVVPVELLPAIRELIAKHGR
ncbi:MAG: hypothetical protein L0177_00335 [Chloroflexi bacterium]|nr:hypothetical protein [Chloroflexota bacterium]